MNLKEEALKYEAPVTKNIADLDLISSKIDVLESEEKTNSEGEKYTYKYCLVNNVEYRIPGIVLEGMKGILDKFPDTEAFIVTRKGTGKATRYQVMPGATKK